ncbi:MAG: hypothetical protein ACK56F_25535 [bacterium]
MKDTHEGKRGERERKRVAAQTNIAFYGVGAGGMRYARRAQFSEFFANLMIYYSFSGKSKY